MTAPNVVFITYTKGPIQFVTSPLCETEFLNWLNRVDDSAGFIRETHGTCGVRCSPREVHAVAKKEAVILRLVKAAE